jgi:hypothetical protein
VSGIKEKRKREKEKNIHWACPAAGGQSRSEKRILVWMRDYITAKIMRLLLYADYRTIAKTA